MDHELLGRWLAGECTPGEQQYIRQRAAADVELRLYLEALRAEAVLPAEDVDSAWKRLVSSIAADTHVRSAPAPVPRRRLPRLLPLSLSAAAAAALLVIGYGAFFGRGGEAPWTEVAAPRGQRAETTLPDGTAVVLSSGSRLRHQQQFGRRREVVLEGEAFFTVVHDARRPFSVRAGNGVITVLGTEFGVRAFPADTLVTVAVRSGLVAIADSIGAGDRADWRGRARAGQHGQHVAAGQVVLLSANGSVAPLSGASVEQSLAWIEGLLVFRDTPLIDVAAELSRLYAVEVVVAEEIAKRRLTGTFRRQQLGDLLPTIGMVMDTEFQTRQDSVFMSSKRLPNHR